MAIPEACGLWIEQRVQEELEAKGETGASFREIARVVSAEIEKYFETKVNPGTIFQRARRMAADTNVSPDQPAEITTETTKSNEIKREPAKDGTMRGGRREGAGRKPREEPEYGAHDMNLSKINGALNWATMAISMLERITDDDPFRNDAFEKVTLWIEKKRSVK